MDNMLLVSLVSSMMMMMLLFLSTIHHHHHHHVDAFCVIPTNTDLSVWCTPDARRRRNNINSELAWSRCENKVRVQMFPSSMMDTADPTSITTLAPAVLASTNNIWLSVADATASSSVVVGDSSEDYGEALKTVAIALTLGGGLIPALISANGGLIKALSGRKGDEPEKESDLDPNNTFDPTIFDMKTNGKYRKYVIDSGASGPDIPNKAFFFAADRIPLADVVAVLGRISSVESIADWKNLPSTKRGQVTGSTPPMWLPRKAFKVNIRKAPWIGWPTDPKTGLPVGGEELKRAEEKRISKKDAIIGDAALDAVFDSWAW